MTEGKKPEITIVDVFPAPEPWQFDEQGKLIGIGRMVKVSKEELRRKYPDAEKGEKCDDKRQEIVNCRCA